MKPKKKFICEMTLPLDQNMLLPPLFRSSSWSTILQSIYHPKTGKWFSSSTSRRRSCMTRRYNKKILPPCSMLQFHTSSGDQSIQYNRICKHSLTRLRHSSSWSRKWDPTKSLGNLSIPLNTLTSIERIWAPGATFWGFMCKIFSI